MAILWQDERDGTRYEVRSAGASRRLYSNGVFHSQYNPGHAVTGSVWDLLALPALLVPGGVRRALVLGVGGGAAIHLLHRYLQAPAITGVELDPVHLRVAREHFGVSPAIATLHQGDAVAWLSGYRGPPFDYIIEDLFGEAGGEPVRAVAMDRGWMGLLSRNLSARGLLVANFAAPAELRSGAWCHDAVVRKALPHALQLSQPENDNVVAVFSRHTLAARALKPALDRQPQLAKARRQGQLAFVVRRLNRD